MTLCELKFDKMEYDTSRAQEFLKEHTVFSGFYCIDSNKIVLDSVGNKICLTADCHLYELINKTDADVDVINKKLMQLSDLIDKNAELFCQLEYMIRNINPNELKAYDLKLMSQNLRYYASNKCKTNWSSKRGLFMNRHSPLVVLAYVAQQVLQNHQIYIVSNEETAVLCWLFASLCKQAGFDNVCLGFKNEAYIPTTELIVHDISDFKSGCYAVVTAKSDIESAIDVLIETPDRFPWNLKYIYVEESVVDRFRTTLEDKVRRSGSHHAIKGKTFIFEYAGKTDLAGTNAVIVEAYRSVKELLSLLSPAPYCLSLWCDSTTENLEITGKVPSNIVWVNGYGLFDGPPETSQSFFSILDIACAGKSRDLEVLKKMSTSERAARLEDFGQVSETEGSFYCVREKYTCAGTREPLNVLAGSSCADDEVIYNRKVVWTSYGTIFSN